MSATWARTAGNIGFLIAFVALVPVLGFFTTTGVYLFLHMTYLGVRPFYLSAAIAIGTLAAFYGLFEVFLGVVVPHGVLF